MGNIQTSLWELLDTMDNLIQENTEITRATKAMMSELGNVFMEEMASLAQIISNLWRFVK